MKALFRPPLNLNVMSRFVLEPQTESFPWQKMKKPIAIVPRTDRPLGAIAPAILALTSLAAVFIGNKNNK
jgi:hypothetical protein